MTTDCIIVDNVRKTYIVREGIRRKRSVEALRGVSFKVRCGTIHALLGPNGAGKTTLVKIISTILLPDDGRVQVLGLDVVREPDKVRKVVGVVLDISKGFYFSLSGYENLVFYGLLKGLSKRDAERRAKEVLELVGLDESAYKRPYHTYSLGMRARVAIAKALMTDPEVLILDEPTLGLDVESARAVRDLLVKLSKNGKTILVTGHNMYEIEMISNHVTIIHKGKVVADGHPEELKLKLGLPIKITLRLREMPKEVEDYLKSEIPIVNMCREDDKLVIYARGRREEIVQSLLEILRRYELPVIDVQIVEPTLEDAYIAALRGVEE
ncbi:MAG: ABC transporter ATP-binding protein [Crenarchaeota archaeon]|nr:ABC transporter ATP-binding protein [Thermoproteota archaeon]